MSSIVIGVAGTHSTGKSTFCRELKAGLELRDIRVETVPSFGALAAQQGIPLLTQHTYDSTMWFIDRTLEAEHAARTDAEVVLVDRPVIDAVAYWSAAVEYRGMSITPHELEAIGNLMMNHVPNYTTVLATKLDHTIRSALGEILTLDSGQRLTLDLHDILGRHAITHQVLSPTAREGILAQCHCRRISTLGVSMMYSSHGMLAGRKVRRFCTLNHAAERAWGMGASLGPAERDPSLTFSSSSRRPAYRHC
ncbi:AAA family ATPase [Pseudomonas aeruginosa]